MVKQELGFYIENAIPLPDKHPDVRHLDRMKKRNPRELYERPCAACGKTMICAYDPSDPRKVYCEECYKKEVY